MNKLLCLSCVILLISVKLQAQKSVGTNPNEPPKRASKIIVMVKDSANTLLDRLSGILFDKGYTIDTKDEKVKYITTKGQPSKNYGTITKVRARINDTAIIFTSQIAVNSDTDILGIKRAEPDYMDVDYRGSKKSAMREAWNELEAIALKFGDKIIYAK